MSELCPVIAVTVRLDLQFALKLPHLARKKWQKWCGRGSKVMDESTNSAEDGERSSRKPGDFIGAIQEKEVEKRSSLIDEV